MLLSYIDESKPEYSWMLQACQKLIYYSDRKQYIGYLMHKNVLDDGIHFRKEGWKKSSVGSLLSCQSGLNMASIYR